MSEREPSAERGTAGLDRRGVKVGASAPSRSESSGDYGKAVHDARGVTHIASRRPYWTTCGVEWVALGFSWETRLGLHCRECIRAAMEATPRVSA